MGAGRRDRDVGPILREEAAGGPLRVGPLGSPGDPSATRPRHPIRRPWPMSAATCRRSRPTHLLSRRSTRRRSPKRSSRGRRSSSRSRPRSSALLSSAARRWTASSRSRPTIINVEPYQLDDIDGQLQPVVSVDPPMLTPTAVTREWGLSTEPWVFVVDGDGIVTASFPLIFSKDELDAALAAVE